MEQQCINRKEILHPGPGRLVVLFWGGSLIPDLLILACFPFLYHFLHLVLLQNVLSYIFPGLPGH